MAGTDCASPTGSASAIMTPAAEFGLGADLAELLAGIAGKDDESPWVGQVMVGRPDTGIEDGLDVLAAGFLIGLLADTPAGTNGFQRLQKV